MEISSHSLVRNRGNSESDESDEGVSNMSRKDVEDPEWTPSSSSLLKKLQDSNTADSIAYRLRSRLVDRSEREAETDKRWAAVVGSPESEHTGNAQGNTPPGKT